MHIIKIKLQPEGDSIWNYKNLAGLQPIFMQDWKLKENMG